MLSMGMLGAGDEDYYISLAGDPERGPAREDEYYTSGSEPPGVWVGAGSGRLGLVGVVEPVDLRAVLAGVHPQTGVSLISKAAMAKRKRPGLFLTFSAPKGVSLLGLLGAEPVEGIVRAAHHEAMLDALGFLEREALFARRGHLGVEQIAAGGFVAAGFEHSTSRAGDPQLHTHVLVANVVEGVNGGWSAPDSRSLFRHARTAGFIYQASLRFGLTSRLGLRWGPVRSGMAEPAGIPKEVLREFSTRRRQIEERLALAGRSSARSAQVAANATRASKDHAVSAAVLRESWRLQAEAAGFGVDKLLVLVRPGHEPTLEADRLIDRLTGPAGLTAHASSFDRRYLLRAVAENTPAGATAAEIERLADQVISDDRVVPLARPDSDGDQLDRPGEARWTTTDLLAVEADLLAIAGRMRSQSSPIGEAAVKRALQKRPTMTAEQKAAVISLAGSDRAAVLVGRAGTGKTFTLDALRDVWQLSGRSVVGAAPSARAAAELQAGSGIPSTTLARLLIDAETFGPGGGLPRGGLMVVDEAGMAGTRSLHRLLTAAERSGTAVVLVGDPAQLPEIEAGGTLRALADRLGAAELFDNRRQEQPWEREALAALRCGRAGEAVSLYRDHGRLVIAETAPDAHQALVADWWAARQEGVSAAMFALRRSEVESLNRFARTLMADSGQLGATELTVAGRNFAAGEEVVALRNDKALGVINGMRATITTVDPDAGAVVIETADGAELFVPSGYLDDGHLDYGYCTTIHKAQGSTVDRAFLLGSEALFKEAGYVGLSRGRQRNDLYVVAETDPHTHAHAHRMDGSEHTDPVKAITDSLAKSRAQQLAIDTGIASPSPALSLAELDAQKERTLDRDVADLDGRRALRRAIEERRGLLVRAALADPGAHLVDALGPPPTSGIARAQWSRAAEAVEGYRDRYQINGRDPLGVEPADRWQKVERDHALQLVEEARIRLGLEQARRHELGIGL